MIFMKYKIKYSDELRHYGVKGMKWGVRKEYEPVGRSRRSTPASKVSRGKTVVASRDVSIDDIRRSVEQKDREIERAHRNHDRIVEKARRTGKSAAEIEQEEESQKRLRLTDTQKKAIKIGAAVAGAALVTYGAYKYNARRRVGFDTNEKDYLPSFRGQDSGKTDFFRDSFGAEGYYAFSNSQENKQTINEMLTSSAGSWWKKLSKAEQDGISYYSTNAYTKMNNALWAAKGDDVSKYTDSATAAYIKAANSALEKASFPHPMICTQGLSMDNACSFLGCSREELIAAAKDSRAASKLIGAVNTNHGLFSTSTTSNSGFTGSVKYKVLTPKGAHAAFIEHISAYGDLSHPPKWDGKKSGGPPFSKEFETLFAAGSKFKTKGIQYNREGGFIEVALEYVLPNPDDYMD